MIFVGNMSKVSSMSDNEKIDLTGQDCCIGLNKNTNGKNVLSKYLSNSGNEHIVLNKPVLSENISENNEQLQKELDTRRHLKKRVTFIENEQKSS